MEDQMHRCRRELVSIIIPVYNGAETLQRCVESVRAQTYTNLQIILVNDGSTDDSGRICDKYVETDLRILAIHQPNGGVSAARNMGLSHARGEYIVFVDADDLIHNQCVEIMLNAMDSDDIDIVICDVEPVFSNDKLELDHSSGMAVRLSDSRKVLRSALTKQNELLYSWGKLWRREMICRIQFQRLSMCEDCLFVFEALTSASKSIAFVHGSPLYYYVQRNDSVTHILAPHHLMDSLQSARLILELSVRGSVALQREAKCYAVNTAFYAYLQSGRKENYIRVQKEADALIKKYRKEILFDFMASAKTRIACMLSFFSMRLVELVYHAVKS